MIAATLQRKCLQYICTVHESILPQMDKHNIWRGRKMAIFVLRLLVNPWQVKCSSTPFKLRELARAIAWLVKLVLVACMMPLNALAESHTCVSMEGY